MKTLLVTGGAGYIGSHAVRALIRQGYTVVVVDNLSRGHREAVDGGSVFVELDLGDVAALEKLFGQYHFDAVLHFAGSLEVGLSMKDPALFFRNNCVNGLNLLEAMRKSNVRNIIFSSSAAVYGNPKTVPIREDAALEPTNFYGTTKLMFEELLQNYDHMFGIKSVALRYFNAAGSDPAGDIGYDQIPVTHLIPRILKTALGKFEQFEIHGTDYETADGTCIRDYIHVVDLVEAHLLALDFILKEGRSEIFNLGNGKGYSVREVVEKALEVTGKNLQIQEGPRRAGDPAVLVADSTKAENVLGWKPRSSSLEAMIESAWKWHSTHPDGYQD